MAAESYYVVEIEHHIAWVFLNRPGKRNAMHPPAWQELPAIMADLDRNQQVRVIVIAGKGDCFCAGIDLKAMLAELTELADPNQLGGVKWRLIPKIKELQETMTAIERCRKPVIAAVHGHCIGAGLDMATACDLRICSEDALFSLKEAAVGFVADVGVLQRLPLIIGQGLTRELAFTARTITARQAQQMQLVSAVFADHDHLIAGARALADEIAANSPLAVQASKDVLNFGVGKSPADGPNYVAAISAAIIPSHDLREAMAAFVEKRQPEFSGT